MIKSVYIAGPIGTHKPIPNGVTPDDRDKEILANVRRAMRVGHRLMHAGLKVYVPHLTLFMRQLEERELETWMAQDFYWLSKCDIFLRLPGHSEGADKEELLARRLGLQVYGREGIHFNTTSWESVITDLIRDHSF